MRVVMLLTVAGLAGLAGGTVAGGLEAQAPGNVHLASVETAAPLESAPSLDERALRRRMESAERAMERGSEITARKMYESIAKELRAAGALPTEAMWMLATLRYRSGDEAGAAAVLDELAVAAGAHGDAVVEARALLEAARIFELEGMAAESVARLDRALRLMSSGALPPEAQVALLRRVRG